jgi:hypothetical protein
MWVTDSDTPHERQSVVITTRWSLELHILQGEGLPACKSYLLDHQFHQSLITTPRGKTHLILTTHHAGSASLPRLGNLSIHIDFHITSKRGNLLQSGLSAIRSRHQPPNTRNIHVPQESLDEEMRIFLNEVRLAIFINREEYGFINKNWLKTGITTLVDRRGA